MKYAVIDVGSNTVRLCVYDVLCPEKRKFKTIMNRKIMAFNSVADEYLLHPIASGYRAVTTPEMRKGMRAFVGNLKTPLSVVNNVLQLNFTDAGKGISRFVINSTLGVFGFFDDS